MRLTNLRGTTRMVLAGQDGYPMTYANRKQAERKQIELEARGYSAFVIHGMRRPFFVAVEPKEVA